MWTSFSKRWLWPSVALLVVAFVVVAVAVDFRLRDSESSNTEGNLSTTTPSSSRFRIVDIVGDSYTSGTSAGGEGASNWVRRANAELGDTVNLIARASEGAGYVTAGRQGQTFADLSNGLVDDDPSVILVFGSRYDLPSWNKVGDAAQSTLASIRKQVPSARIVVVSPPWVNAAPPPELVAIKNELRQQATSLGADFVDTLAEGWFFKRTQLIGGDGVSPTDAGHQYLADKMIPIIKAALAGN